MQISSRTVGSEGKRSVLICLISVLLCTRHILQLMGVSDLASLLFKVLYALVFVFLLSVFVKSVSQHKKMTGFLLFIVDLLALAALSVVLIFSYRRYFESAITFLLAFPMLFCSNSICIHHKDARLYFRALTLVAIVLAVLPFGSSGYKQGVLMLYTGNGNQCGLLYMSVFLGIYIYQFINKSNLFFWLLQAGLLYGCWQTESRTAFIACIMCVGLSLMLVRFPRWTNCTFLVFMVGFIVLPLLVTTLMEWFGRDLNFMGASVWTGREEIWPRALEKVREAPFRINLGRVLAENYDVELGAHNVWLDVAWRFSLPIAILFLISLYHTGKRFVTAVNIDRRAVALVACFGAGLLHMSLEAAIISGALDYTLYFLLAVFCGMALTKRKEDLTCNSR